MSTDAVDSVVFYTERVNKKIPLLANLAVKLPFYSNFIVGTMNAQLECQVDTRIQLKRRL